NSVHTGGLTFLVPKMEGTLPPDCQADLDELRSFIHHTLSNSMPEKAVKASEIRIVLLTGATGFIGRFMLKDLLTQHPEIRVYCLVRADDEHHGLERIKQALSIAEIWQEEFAHRIHVLIGDICQPNFGLSDERFE